MVRQLQVGWLQVGRLQGGRLHISRRLHVGQRLHVGWRLVGQLLQVIQIYSITLSGNSVSGGTVLIIGVEGSESRPQGRTYKLWLTRGALAARRSGHFGTLTAQPILPHYCGDAWAVQEIFDLLQL